MSVSEDSRQQETALADLKGRILKRELVLPPQVEKLAAVAFARPDLLAFETTNTIAVQAGVSKTTVARFVRFLGKGSLKETREIFREELRRRSMRRAQ